MYVSQISFGYDRGKTCKGRVFSLLEENVDQSLTLCVLCAFQTGFDGHLGNIIHNAIVNNAPHYHCLWLLDDLLK